MRENDQWALMCSLVEHLRNEGSWAGETHVQNAAYLLKHLAKVPLSYDFILYRQGPFSFELRDELAFLRSGRALVLQPQGQYGPKLQVLDPIQTETANSFKSQVGFVAKSIGNKGVSDLEALSTALMVVLEHNSSHMASREDRLLEIKPHLTKERAIQAIEEIERLREEFSSELVEA